jgi:hypothetical protein
MVKIPKLQKGGQDGTLPSMFLFGISYAVASLSCTIGPFLAVTTSTFRSESWLAGLGVFVAYGLGMGVVIAILTVAVALAKSGVVQRFRNVLPVMNRIAGGLLVVAGAYVAYYGWYEIRVLDGATDDPIVDRAIELQTWLQNRIVPDDPVALHDGRRHRACHAHRRRHDRPPASACSTASRAASRPPARGRQRRRGTPRRRYTATVTVHSISAVQQGADRRRSNPGTAIDDTECVDNLQAWSRRPACRDQSGVSCRARGVGPLRASAGRATGSTETSAHDACASSRSSAEVEGSTPRRSSSEKRPGPMTTSATRPARSARSSSAPGIGPSEMTPRSCLT